MRLLLAYLTICVYISVVNGRHTRQSKENPYIEWRVDGTELSARPTRNTGVGFMFIHSPSFVRALGIWGVGIDWIGILFWFGGKLPMSSDSSVESAAVVPETGRRLN